MVSWSPGDCGGVWENGSSAVMLPKPRSFHVAILPDFPKGLSQMETSTHILDSDCAWSGQVRLSGSSMAGLSCATESSDNAFHREPLASTRPRPCLLASFPSERW